MEYGFIRVGAAVPELKVGDCKYNRERIIELINRGEKLKIQILVFPELSLTGYTCGDLFYQSILLEDAKEQLGLIREATRNTNILSIIGMPLNVGNYLFNCAVAIQRGKILAVVPKTHIPNNNGLSEGRWFVSGGISVDDMIFLCGQEVPFGVDLIFKGAKTNANFGIEICEDVMTPIPPSVGQALAGALITFNLSADVEIIGKEEKQRNIIQCQSSRCISGYIYTSAGINESTTDVVFGGHAMICENGKTLCESERLSDKEQLIYTEIDTQRLMSERRKSTIFRDCPRTDFPKYREVGFEIFGYRMDDIKRSISPYPFVPSTQSERNKRCSKIFSIQSAALAKRIRHTSIRRAVLGVSGGLDSTQALLAVVKTFDMLNIKRQNIIAVTMPGFGTTDTTLASSIELAKTLKVDLRIIDIKDACIQHFKDIGQDPLLHNTTYENVQARERTQILMDIANKENGLVIGTGDLSELVLGWCTYNGDHMSMYSVNCGIPKTLIRHLIEWAAGNLIDGDTGRILSKILETPISPELLPPGECGNIKQKTEDIIGPYELHDFFIYHMLGYGANPEKIVFLAFKAFKGKYTREAIKGWLSIFIKRFFSHQFKRSCLPDGPRIGSINLSPRRGLCMPSDAQADSWLFDLDT